MNLSDIMRAAQGGQVVDNLAAQFGLTPGRTQAAIQAMIPAFSAGLQRAADDPAALAGLAAHLASGAGLSSFADPIPAAAAGPPGAEALARIFGSPQTTARVAQQACEISGVDAQTIGRMMPVVASILMGGLAHSLEQQGLGGLLGQLANAGGAPGAPATPAQGGAFGGLIGSVLGGLFGAAPASPQATALQAGVNTLTRMFESGVPVSQTHQQGLDEILRSAVKSAQG